MNTYNKFIYNLYDKNSRFINKYDIKNLSQLLNYSEGYLRKMIKIKLANSEFIHHKNDITKLYIIKLCVPNEIFIKKEIKKEQITVINQNYLEISSHSSLVPMFLTSKIETIKPQINIHDLLKTKSKTIKYQIFLHFSDKTLDISTNIDYIKNLDINYLSNYKNKRGRNQQILHYRQKTPTNTN